MRAVLTRLGVTQMTMKPVLRQYAFEEEAVRHGRQWVLKVRYAASQPALGLGLTGTSFKAVFGGNQSCLESLVLKRRVMGPGWLALRQPRRVAPEGQVSWCKLEVEVSSHKDVAAAGAEAASRDAPPLTVAALSLKTMLGAGAGAAASGGAGSEVAAVSVVYLSSVRTDGPMAQDEWNSAKHLRHFSAVRRLEGTSFPAGARARGAARRGACPGGVGTAPLRLTPLGRAGGLAQGSGERGGCIAPCVPRSIRCCSQPHCAHPSPAAPPRV